MGHSRARAGLDAIARRRLEEALARSQAMIERSRRTIERGEALLVETAERLHARSSPHPLLHALGEGEQVR